MLDLQCLFDDLIRVETELWNVVDTRLRAECGLPLGRFEVMRVIARHGCCCVQHIAADLSITIGGASKVVDRIEAAGHCTRRANPADGRSSLIELTPAGSCVLAAASSVLDNELERRLGSVLSPESLEHLSTTLSVLRAAAHAPCATSSARQDCAGAGSQA
jgi:DNA-binding MarR family transcriptional regulator